jgi:LacI family transcriptional regulator
VHARLSGFSAVLPPRAVVEGDFTREGGRTSTLELLGQAAEVTAIFALNDLMAVGALAALRELGREEVSVVGFDDLPVAVDVTPALTTVRLDLMAIGASAMELVLDEHEPRRTVEAPASLVVRGSTRKAPKN